MKPWIFANSLTTLTAVYAALVGTIAIAIAWMAERRARRAEMATQRENVRIKRVFAGRVSTPEAELRVEIVNEGYRDVPIRAVSLDRSHDDWSMKLTFETGARLLRPGDYAIYARPFEELLSFKESWQDDVSIVVRSHLGELDHVDGSEALRLLEEHLPAEQ